MAVGLSDAGGLYAASFYKVSLRVFAPYVDITAAPTPDTTPPVIEHFVPPLGATLSAQQSITFDATDDSGRFRRVLVHAVFSDGVVEVVHDGDGFRGYYQGSSSRVMIANGYRYTVLRTGGWPSSPATFNVFAIDASGNEAA